MEAFLTKYTPFLTIPLAFIFLEQAISYKKRHKAGTSQALFWVLFGLSLVGTLLWAILKFV